MKSNHFEKESRFCHISLEFFKYIILTELTTFVYETCSLCNNLEFTNLKKFLSVDPFSVSKSGNIRVKANNLNNIFNLQFYYWLLIIVYAARWENTALEVYINDPIISRS